MNNYLKRKKKKEKKVWVKKTTTNFYFGKKEREKERERQGEKEREKEREKYNNPFLTDIIIVEPNISFQKYDEEEVGPSSGVRFLIIRKQGK